MDDCGEISKPGQYIRFRLWHLFVVVAVVALFSTSLEAMTFLAAGLFLFQMGFSLVAPPPYVGSVRAQGRWLFFVPLMQIAGFVGPAAGVWSIVGWFLVWGDNGPPPMREFLRWPTAFAVAFAALTGLRMYGWGTTGRYAQVNLMCSLALVTVCGIIVGQDLAKPMDGINPQTVAQENLTKLGQPEWRLVEVRRSAAIPGVSRERIVYFAQDENGEPRRRIDVCKYGWYWWQSMGSARLEPQSEVLDRINRIFDQQSEDYSNPESDLLEIIELYEGTPAGDAARKKLVEYQSRVELTVEEEHRQRPKQRSP